MQLAGCLGRNANKHPEEGEPGREADAALTQRPPGAGGGEKDAPDLLDVILRHSLAHPPFPKTLGAPHPG